MIKAAAALILLVASTSAHAERWLIVSNSGDIITSMDLDTVKRKGNTVRAWFHDEYKDKDPRDGTHGQTMLRVYDCEEQTAQTLQITTYASRRRDNPSGTYTPQKPAQFVSPGTVGELALEAACTTWTDDLLQGEYVFPQPGAWGGKD